MKPSNFKLTEFHEQRFSLKYLTMTSQELLLWNTTVFPQSMKSICEHCFCFHEFKSRALKTSVMIFAEVSYKAATCFDIVRW